MNLSKPYDIKAFLDMQAAHFNQLQFIENDPICIPHLYTEPKDIEIAGLLVALIAWGQRPEIIKKGKILMELLDNQPHEFLTRATPGVYRRFEKFVYRTLRSDDLLFILQGMKRILEKYNSLEACFYHYGNGDVYQGILGFRYEMLQSPHLLRSRKHLADPSKGSAAKRLNMFLRWMVRKDKNGVDFGIWNKFSPSGLYCPLDIHSGRSARKLGLIERRQNNWKTVEELTKCLRLFDPDDPVKYDFALFGLSEINAKCLG